MIQFEGHFCGAAGPATLPTLYVYSYGKESRYTRYLVFEFDLAELMTQELDVFTLVDLVSLVAGGAARVDEVVTVLAGALDRSMERLFTRPPVCAIAREQLTAAVRATAAVLHHLTDTVGPLIFAEFKGEALRDY
jgi:hypothetical protein